MKLIQTATMLLICGLCPVGWALLWNEYSHRATPVNLLTSDQMTTDWDWHKKLCLAAGVDPDTDTYSIVCPHCDEVHILHTPTATTYRNFRVEYPVIKSLKPGETVAVRMDECDGQTYCYDCGYPVGWDWIVRSESSTGFRPVDRNDPNSGEVITDTSIHRLSESGRACAVMGHKIEWNDLIFWNVPSMQLGRCSLCPKVDWKQRTDPNNYKES